MVRKSPLLADPWCLRTFHSCEKFMKIMKIPRVPPFFIEGYEQHGIIHFNPISGALGVNWKLQPHQHINLSQIYQYKHVWEWQVNFYTVKWPVDILISWSQFFKAALVNIFILTMGNVKGVAHSDDPTENNLQTLQFPSALRSILASLSSLFKFYAPVFSTLINLASVKILW